MVTKHMAQVEEHPMDALRRWLLHEWRGSYDFVDVRVERRETADLREEAWYIYPVVEGGPDTEWDGIELGAVDVAVRDKALELGLEYPWFVLVTPADEGNPPADDDPSGSPG